MAFDLVIITQPVAQTRQLDGGGQIHRKTGTRLGTHPVADCRLAALILLVTMVTDQMVQ